MPAELRVESERLRLVCSKTSPISPTSFLADDDDEEVDEDELRCRLPSRLCVPFADMVALKAPLVEALPAMREEIA